MDTLNQALDILPDYMPQVLDTVKWPNKILTEKSSPILSGINSKELNNFIDDMLETMRANKALGLSAVQVGVPQRVVVISDGVAAVNNNGEVVRYQTELVIINPVLSNFEGNTFAKEGCISFPGVSECVKRYSDVTVKGLDRNGKHIEYNLIGNMAKAIQHEVDHLDGIVFLDKMTDIRKKSALKTYRRIVRKISR